MYVISQLFVIRKCAVKFNIDITVELQFSVANFQACGVVIVCFQRNVQRYNSFLLVVSE